MPNSAPAERKADYSRLTRDEVASILTLHRAGKNQLEIAQALGCDHSTVSRWLDKLTDSTELAKQTLRSGALKLAERVIADADVEQSLEVLDRLEVAPKRQQDSARSAVLINIGMPGSPAGPDPLAPVTIISNYQTQKESAALTGQALTDTAQGQIEAKVEGETE